MFSWAASRRWNESLSLESGQQCLFAEPCCIVVDDVIRSNETGQSPDRSNAIEQTGQYESAQPEWQTENENKEREAYDCAEPPARGAPVSPSAILGARAEKDRVARARLAVDKGRTMDWRSMVIKDEGDVRGS